MGHSPIWKLICAICVCNILTVGVHLSSTPRISGPGSATVLNSSNATYQNINCFIASYDKNDSLFYKKSQSFTGPSVCESKDQGTG